MEMNEQNFTDLVKCVTLLRREVVQIGKHIAAETKPFYTNQEMMDMLGVSSPTLKKWRDEGQLGFSQIGLIYYYSKADIVKFLSDTHLDAYAFPDKH